MKSKAYYSGYNCVLLAVYNNLRNVYKLDFDFCLLGLPKNYFQLYVYSSGLTNGLPHETAQQFLQKIDANMCFPDTGSLDGAIEFVNSQLNNHKAVAAAINLRYSVLDPTDFDSDAWNFQLITGIEKDGSYSMFDMFHGKHYQVDEAYLKTMIDTGFNYRHNGQFTPFLQIALPGAKQSQQVLDTITPYTHLSEVLLTYNLTQMLSIVEPFIERLKAKGQSELKKGELYNEIYRLMGSQMILIKGRAQLISSLIQHSFNLPADMQILSDRWTQFSHLIPMTLGRNDSAEYERLQKMLIALFHFEYTAIQQTIQLNESITTPASKNEMGRKFRTV